MDKFPPIRPARPQVFASSCIFAVIDVTDAALCWNIRWASIIYILYLWCDKIDSANTSFTKIIIRHWCCFVLRSFHMFHAVYIMKAAVVLFCLLSRYFRDISHHSSIDVLGFVCTWTTFVIQTRIFAQTSHAKGQWRHRCSAVSGSWSQKGQIGLHVQFFAPFCKLLRSSIGQGAKWRIDASLLHEHATGFSIKSVVRAWNWMR